jgi:pre-mRNA-processing factor 19
MFCNISGEVPQEPVISKTSGHVFERRLIEKSLEASKGVCPVTGNELSVSDLLPASHSVGILATSPLRKTVII